jgi:hypothetical protein
MRGPDATTGTIGREGGYAKREAEAARGGDRDADEGLCVAWERSLGLCVARRQSPKYLR